MGFWILDASIPVVWSELTQTQICFAIANMAQICWHMDRADKCIYLETLSMTRTRICSVLSRSVSRRDVTNAKEDRQVASTRTTEKLQHVRSSKFNATVMASQNRRHPKKEALPASRIFWRSGSLRDYSVDSCILSKQAPSADIHKFNTQLLRWVIYSFATTPPEHPKHENNKTHTKAQKSITFNNFIESIQQQQQLHQQHSQWLVPSKQHASPQEARPLVSR